MLDQDEIRWEVHDRHRIARLRNTCKAPSVAQAQTHRKTRPKNELANATREAFPMIVMRDYHPITAILEMPSPHTRGA